MRNFQDLVASVDILGALAPASSAILCPEIIVLCFVIETYSYCSFVNGYSHSLHAFQVHQFLKEREHVEAWTLQKIKEERVG